jgi:hypothetical protein
MLRAGTRAAISCPAASTIKRNEQLNQMNLSEPCLIMWIGMGYKAGTANAA